MDSSHMELGLHTVDLIWELLLLVTLSKITVNKLLLPLSEIMSLFSGKILNAYVIYAVSQHQQLASSV
jgi:hypothetical protein